jgi:hypothetical protein
MNQTTRKLIQKRQVLLERLAALRLLVQGSYLERFSSCSRPNCSCHNGKKHGPRSYLVVYEGKKQRQIYIPQEQRKPIQEGIRQHEDLRAIVKEITRINVRLMRDRALATSGPTPRKGGKRHE